MDDAVCPECGHGSGAQEQACQLMLDAMTSESETSERTAQRSMLLGLAAAVDANPDRGALWREYRIAESAFRNDGAGDLDEFSVLVAALSADDE